MGIILVTGATGFVGRHVVNAVLKNPSGQFECVGTYLHSRPEDLSNINLRQLDITDPKKVSQLIATVQPKAVIHLAGVAEPAAVNANRKLGWKVNFRGTMNIADAIMQTSPATRLIFASSSEVYGASFGQLTLPLNERAPLQPMNAYAASKAMADLSLGQMAHEGLDCVRFRAFNHCGPGQGQEYVVPTFAKQVAMIEAKMSEPKIFVGNLSAERDFLDVRDVARAYAAAVYAEVDPIQDGAMNLARGTMTSVEDILRCFIEISGVDVEVVVAPDRLRPIDIPKVSGDASRALRVLGWSPNIPLTDTLKAVLDDFRRRIST